MSQGQPIVPSPSRDVGKLPSQPEVNPRAQSSTFDSTYTTHAQAKVMTTLRSGKVVKNNKGDKPTETKSACIPLRLCEPTHVPGESGSYRLKREVDENSTYPRWAGKQPTIETDYLVVPKREITIVSICLREACTCR